MLIQRVKTPLINTTLERLSLLFSFIAFEWCQRKFDFINLIERTIQNLRQDVDRSPDISDTASLEIEKLRKLTNYPDEVISFSVQVESEKIGYNTQMIVENSTN